MFVGGKKAAKIKGLVEKGKLGAKGECGADRALKRMPELWALMGQVWMWQD